MDYDIVETPYSVTLYGFRGKMDGQLIPVVGKRLMDAMWAELKHKGIHSKGLNHWVYLPNSEMFVGVELNDGVEIADNVAVEATSLEKYEVKLARYLHSVHRGNYGALPGIWSSLLSRLKEISETLSPPSLEVYGHWNPDPNKAETTILIGLAAKE